MTALETIPEDGRDCGPELERCIPVLETERVALRQPRLEDARDVAAIADDRRVAEMTGSIPNPYHVTDAEAWIAAAWTNRQSNPFLIHRKSEGALLGATGFIDHADDDPEIGYWLGVEHWGKGYATESTRAVIDYLFAARNVAAVQARARVVNPASRRVLEKCGFQWIGVGLAKSKVLAGSIPVDRFRLDRGTWASIKAWRDPVTRRDAARRALA